jgi:hypothetical protein
MLSMIELTGICLGMFGGSVMVIPEVFEKMCFGRCFKNKRNYNNDIQENETEIVKK